MSSRLSRVQLSGITPPAAVGPDLGREGPGSFPRWVCDGLAREDRGPVPRRTPGPAQAARRDFPRAKPGSPRYAGPVPAFARHASLRPRLERGLTWGLGVAIALLCLFARSRQLDLRPLHGDEAVQARILAELFAGRYRYDPFEFHGPLLHDLAAPLAAVRGETTWQTLSIIPLRATAALATALLCLTPLLLRRWLTNPGAVAAAAVLALDPMLFYYGRDYIAEPVFVACLGLFAAAAARAWLSRSRGWAITAAAALAAAWAAKETWVLHAAAFGLAILPFSLLFRRCLGTELRSGPAPATLARHLLLPVSLAFLLTWAVLFSQAFTSPSGLPDSLRSYLVYLQRSGGEGHEKPFGHYVQILFGDPHFTPKPARLNWPGYFRLLWTDPQRLRPWQSELPLLILAILGLASSVMPVRLRLHPGRRPDPRLLAWLVLSAALLLLAYSLLRYKTIWSVLGVPALLALPAGAGLAWLVQAPLLLWRRGTRAARRLAPLAALLLLAAAVVPVINLRAQLLWQNFEVDHSVSPSNPWVYSQAPTALLRLPRRLDAVLAQPAARPAANPDQPARVVALSHSGIWPLPWYLRGHAYGVLPDPAGLAALGGRDRLRAEIAAVVVGPENGAAATPLLESLGYRPDLLVQNYESSWVRLWIRDDLLAPAE